MDNWRRFDEGYLNNLNLEYVRLQQKYIYTHTHTSETVSIILIKNIICINSNFDIYLSFKIGNSIKYQSLRYNYKR